MANDIRFVFSDIDGTIFHGKQLVPSAIEAMAKLRERKIGVALCTGRSVLHTQEIQDQLGISYGVYFNGGLVKYGDEIIYSTPLASDVVTRIDQFAEAHSLPLIFHTDEEAYVLNPMPKQYERLLNDYDFPPLELISRSEWENRDWHVYQANVMMEASWEQLVQNQIPECLIYRWDTHAVDLQRRGCDKSIGALALLNHLNLSADHAVHIGDGGNDIGMFDTMKLGIAMGNAPKDVKQKAERETASVAEDGFYHALRDLGLI